MVLYCKFGDVECGSACGSGGLCECEGDGIVKVESGLGQPAPGVESLGLGRI
jgi:hypothetical protein